MFCTKALWVQIKQYIITAWSLAAFPDCLNTGGNKSEHTVWALLCLLNEKQKTKTLHRELLMSRFKMQLLWWRPPTFQCSAPHRKRERTRPCDIHKQSYISRHVTWSACREPEGRDDTFSWWPQCRCCGSPLWAAGLSGLSTYKEDNRFIFIYYMPSLWVPRTFASNEESIFYFSW